MPLCAPVHEHNSTGELRTPQTLKMDLPLKQPHIDRKKKGDINFEDIKPMYKIIHFEKVKLGIIQYILKIEFKYVDRY